jgi:hypothetical protein
LMAYTLVQGFHGALAHPLPGVWRQKQQ